MRKVHRYYQHALNIIARMKIYHLLQLKTLDHEYYKVSLLSLFFIDLSLLTLLFLHFWMGGVDLSSIINEVIRGNFRILLFFL